MAPLTCPYFNPDLMLATKNDIEFDQDMQFLYLDMACSEIPTMSMYQAKPYIQDIYDLIMFTHRVFCNHELPSHLYLLQREQPIPGDKLMRYANIDGYILLAAFSKEEFDTHFPTICHAAIAINNGYRSRDSMKNKKLSLEELADSLLGLDAAEGTFVGKDARRPKKPVGHFEVIKDLDSSIEEYHHNRIFDEDGNRRRRVCTDKSQVDSVEMWLERARLLSWEYYVNQSDRMLQIKDQLFSLGKLLLRRNNLQDTPLHSLENLNEMAKNTDDDHLLTGMFKTHVAWLNWKNNVKQDMEGKTILDLRKRIAWDISEYRFDFYINRFLLIPIDEDLMNHVASEKGKDISRMNEDQMLDLHQDVLTLCRDKLESAIDDRIREEAESLYPVLDKLARDTYEPVAKSLSKEGKICRLYQDPPFQAFFAEKYRSSMASASRSNMSKARKVQYDTIHTLTTPKMFQSGYMNTLLDTEEHRRILVFSSDTPKVDPLQDALANHFLRMARKGGVRQMTNEYFIMLLANIWSFTPIENKPIVVLDGAPGCGKSNCSLVAKMTVGWKNPYAARTENYATSRSQTVPEEGERYSSVLGTRIINEWASENMTRDTSVDATILKNLYDSGLCTSLRACKTKSERGAESFRKTYDVSLDNRTMVILANGFEACWSIRDRCLIYNVPALKVSINSCSLAEMQKDLHKAAIPAHFALIRYLISEQINRDSLNLSLKAFDSQKMSPSYETELALDRVGCVLNEMGFKENDLTQRKKDNISRFALILAHYRASFEVYGTVWKTACPRKPNPEEKLCDYNDYLVKVMADYLQKKKKNERDMMLARRVVVDPSDIITASTLLLQLDRCEEDLLKVIAIHMTSFDQIETENKEQYFVVENVTLARLHREMKTHGHGILHETLKKRLQTLEDRARLEQVASLKLTYDNTGVNKNREKNERLFNLHVNAEFAAKTFMSQEQKQVGTFVSFVTERIKQIILGREAFAVYKYANHSDGEGITRWFKGFMAMPVSTKLRRTVGFLSLLHKKDGKDKYIYDGFPEAGVHPDFAKCRARAMQTILLEMFEKNSIDGENPPSFSFQDKYLAIETKSAKCFNQPGLPGLPEKRNEPVMPLVEKETCQGGEESASIKVHVDVFTSKFDEVDGIRELRNHIVAQCIKTGELATENYFHLTDYNMCHRINRNHHMMEGKVTNTNTDPFMVDTKHLYLAPSLLNRIAPFVTRKKSTYRLFVENCLCENMTDLASVMFFDRELVYETQEEEDAIGFVNVKDVAESLPSGKLPEWDTSCVSQVTDTAEEDVYSEVLSKMTVKKTPSKKFTFKPCHRMINLGLKHLYASNKMNQLMKKAGEQATSSSEAKTIFKEELEKCLDRTKAVVLKHLLYPIIHKPDKAEGLASDVYHENHPFLKICVSSQKRKSDSSQERQSKRRCLSIQ